MAERIYSVAPGAGALATVLWIGVDAIVVEGAPDADSVSVHEMESGSIVGSARLLTLEPRGT